MTQIPNGYRLAGGYSRKRIASDDYEHLTVADLIEILNFYPQDANVWVEPKSGIIMPLEMTSGHDGNVFLG